MVLTGFGPNPSCSLFGRLYPSTRHHFLFTRFQLGPWAFPNESNEMSPHRTAPFKLTSHTEPLSSSHSNIPQYWLHSVDTQPCEQWVLQGCDNHTKLQQPPPPSPNDVVTVTRDTGASCDSRAQVTRRSVVIARRRPWRLQAKMAKNM